jgi:hypothetical protein
VVGSEQHQDSYFSRLHFVLVVTLLLLTIGLSLAAWAIRPSSGGFTAVPGNLELYVPTAPLA